MEKILNFIGFTNLNHFSYFIGTFPVFLFLLYFVLFKPKSNLIGSVIALSIVAMIITYRAIKVVIIDKAESDIYSICCVYYNSFLALGYIGLGIYNYVKL